MTMKSELEETVAPTAVSTMQNEEHRKAWNILAQHCTAPRGGYNCRPIVGWEANKGTRESLAKLDLTDYVVCKKRDAGGKKLFALINAPEGHLHKYHPSCDDHS